VGTWAKPLMGHVLAGICRYERVTVNHEQCSFYLLSVCCGSECKYYYRWGLFLILKTSAQEGAKCSVGSILIRPRLGGTHRKWVWGMPERRRSIRAQFLKLTVFKTLPPARNPENVAKRGVQSVFGANLAYPVQHIFIRLVHRVYRVSRHVRRAGGLWGPARYRTGHSQSAVKHGPEIASPAGLIWTDTDT
jgi:hypothetical protein